MKGATLRKLTILVLGLLLCGPLVGQDAPFVRGDANGDGTQNIADPVFMLDFLFGLGISICMDAMDANDDGVVDIADPVYELAFLFSSGSPPPAPFPDCGTDPTFDLLDCVGPVPGCPSAIPCFDSAECPAGFYCEKPIGDCDGEGVCVEIPIACVDVYDPVCGCDGNTYDNACNAAFAGVSIAYEVPCVVGLCFDNADCGPGEFCLKDPGDCSGPGVCTPSPFVCILIYDPVCGCDGITYGNECMAWGAGVSVESFGPCP